MPKGGLPPMATGGYISHHHFVVPLFLGKGGDKRRSSLRFRLLIFRFVLQIYTFVDKMYTICYTEFQRMVV